MRLRRRFHRTKGGYDSASHGLKIEGGAGMVPAPRPIASKRPPQAVEGAILIMPIDNQRYSNIILDSEFQSLFSQLSVLERDELKRSLLTEGCRDRLVVWKNHNILLDGYERFRICQENAVQYGVIEIEFPDREAAIAWKIGNQLGRRNLTREEMNYLRGKHYLVENKGHGGDRHSEESSGNTAEKLAAEYNVDPKTIRNNGVFASDIDRITGNQGELGSLLKTALLSGDVHLTSQQVHQVAGMEPSDAEGLITKILETGKMPAKPKDDGTANPAQAEIRISVPSEAVDLVKTLLRRKGPSYVEKVRDAATAVLEERNWPASTVCRNG
jgi:hypothetical protein